MKEKNQPLLRLAALVLLVLLAFSAVSSERINAAAEESAPVRDAYEINIDYMEDRQALQISQRLVYHNTASVHLDRVCFYASPNMYRRESALVYESEVLEEVFPAGFAPAGVDLQFVSCNGEDADWGVQGANEMALRVSCDLEPGESCVFEFQYYLLLSENRSMTGYYETDVRLSGFYFAPAVYDEDYGDFVLHNPLQFTRWLFTGAADYTVTLTLPDLYLPAATGKEEQLSTENHRTTWRFTAENVHEFALSFGRRYREPVAGTPSGVTVRVLANDRSGAAHALSYAQRIIGLYEDWLGEFPLRQIDVVQSDYPLDYLNFPGVIWISNDLFGDDAKLESVLRFCLAQQYLGMSAYTEPVADAWLSDVPCSYLSLLAVEELEGYNTFLKALNNQVLASLNITIPGNLYITLDADLFLASDYDVVVRDRGTVVMHEMRVAMGRDALLSAMRLFYQNGKDAEAVTEMDLVAAFNQATGGDWETFFADWLYSVDDYVGQQIDFYE